MGVSRGPSQERDWLGTAFIALVALVPRLYVAIAWAREPVWDGHYYHFAARRIAQGFGYSDDSVVGGQLIWHPWSHYPVGYSGFLAGMYRAFGDALHVAPIANAVLGALLAGVTHRFARYAMPSFRARVAGFLVAIFPGLIVYSALVMSEVLAAFGIMLGGWVLVRNAQRRSTSAAAQSGIVLGLTTLVRPQTILIAPMIGLIQKARGIWKKAALGFVAVGFAILVVSPWTARNCRVMDGCALVSTNAGWNLAIGSFPRATGRFETLRATDGCSIVTGQVQQDRCWFSAGLAWIRENPVRWISLVPEKLSQTFDHESFAMGYLGEADPGRWTQARQATGRYVLTLLHRLLLTTALLGMLSWPRERRMLPILKSTVSCAFVAILIGYAWTNNAHPFWPLAVAIFILYAIHYEDAEPGIGFVCSTIGTIILTHAIFFGEDRYHMVITPALCVLAARVGARSTPEARRVRAAP